MSKGEDAGPQDVVWGDRVKRVDLTGAEGAPLAPEPYAAPPELEVPRAADRHIVAVIDHALPLEEVAVRRIERRLRQAVLDEIAELDFVGEVIVTAVKAEGRREIQVRLVRE